MASCLHVLQLLLLILYITDISQSTNVISCLQGNCQNTITNCPDNDDCIITCNTPDACSNTIINCPSNHACDILCDDINSCKNSTFNGQYALTLDITGCNEYESCFDITIYCPTRTNEINCFIEGNDNLGSDISIYAMNGWNDIDIDYNGTFNNNLHGTMHCNTDYNTPCNIASNKWECITNKCNINNNNNSNNNDNNDIEMIIIVTTLIVTFCFISICCWYNNKNRKKIKTSTNTTDSNTLKTIDGDHTITDTNYTNKKHIKGEIPSKKTKPSNDIIIMDKANKNKNTNLNVKHSSKPNSLSTMTVTASKTSKSTHPTSKSQSAMSMEITTDIDVSKGSKGSKQNITIHRSGRSGSDINMVQRKGRGNVNSTEYMDGYNRYNKDIKQNEKIEYKGYGNDNVNAIDSDINQQSVRHRKHKEIRKVAVHNNDSMDDKLAIINEQQVIENNNGNNLNVNNNNEREQLQFKPNTSDSEPMFMKSPDTWSNFEKENGILDDQYAINQMMGYLEEGAIACSYD